MKPFEDQLKNTMITQKNYNVESLGESSFFIVTSYLVFVFWLHGIMKNGQSVNLRKQFALWHLFQFILNIGMLLTGIIEIFWIKKSISSVYGGLFVWMFRWSKVWELSETAFIVLIKDPVTRWQIVNHILTVITTWNFCTQETYEGIAFALMITAAQICICCRKSAKYYNICLPELRKIILLQHVIPMCGLFVFYTIPFTIGGSLLLFEGKSRLLSNAILLLQFKLHTIITP